MIPRRHHPCEHCKKVDFFDKKISESTPPSCHVKPLVKGSSLFHEGDDAENIFYLKHGTLRFYKTWDDGSRQIVRLVFPGEIFGYPALLSNEPYSVTAQAREDCTICIWNGNHFLEEVTQKPELAQKLLKLMCQDLRHSRQTLLHRSVLSVEKRLAQFVLDLCSNHHSALGVKTNWATIARTEASQITGAKQETVSRILHRWKREGLVLLHGKQVLVQNPDKLEKLLEDDTDDDNEPPQKKIPEKLSA